MQYSEMIIFDDYNDMSEALTSSLRRIGIEKATVKDGNISFLGEGHPALWKKVSLTGEEVLGDFEGIDDDTKKIAKVIPIEKCKAILTEAFDYEGEIEEHDGKVRYIRTDIFCESIHDTARELLEKMTFMLSDEVLAEVGEDLAELARLHGCEEIAQEIESKAEAF